MRKTAQKKVKNNASCSKQKANSSWKNLVEFFLLVPCFMLLIAYGLLHTGRVEAAAGVNRTINFQGKVVNKIGGTNVTDGSYTFTFKIYDSASAGNLLWGGAGGESQSLTVTNGIFQAALGSVRSFATDSLDFNQDNLWLEISFNGETFGSRIRLAAVPYALSAEKVSGLTVTNNGGNTLNIAANKTVTFNNSLTFSGTDSTTMTLPSSSTTVAGLSIAQTFTNAQTISPTQASAVGLTVNTTTNATPADGIDLVTAHTSGTATNALLINQNAAGTTTNGIQIQQTSGTLTNGLVFNGTITNDITTGTSGRALTIKTNGGGGITLDTGSPASVNIGNTNASSITIGNTSASNNTAITLTTGGTGVITLGSNTGVGNVVIQPNAGGQAALIIKDNGVGDLLTASSGATSKFVVSNAGVLSLIGGQTTDIDTIGTTNTLKIGANSQNGLTLGRSGAATTINGSGLTIGPTSWTATPTISGLIIASSGVSIGSSQSYTGTGAVTLSSGAGTALTIDSGTTGALNIGTGANGKTITIGNTTANTALTLTTGGTGIITLGSNTGVGNVVIQPNAGGQAALVINDQGTGDIFTASASGTTRFRVSSTGGALFQGDILTSIGSGGSGNGSSAVVNAIGDEGSMVPNAGFESVISNSLADGWFPAATTSASVFSRDTSTPAKGNASLVATLSNSTAAIYSTCIPISGAVGQYTLNYYGKASSTKMSLASWIDGYTSRANCQTDISPTLSLVKSVALTTSWALYGSGTTAIPTFGSTATWARVHFLFSCTSGCSNITGEIDGVRLTEQSTGQGLDYAENYPADPRNIPQPGDVVSLEVLHGAAAVIPANKQQDSSVIGVVSTNPGQVLDDGSVTDPKVSIALAGRIPTKVSTQNGEIHIGDYLASSHIPGVAVKADSAGSVIGVAMEDYTQIDPTVIGKVVMFVKNSYYDGGSGLAGVPSGITNFLGISTQQGAQVNDQNIPVPIGQTGSSIVTTHSKFGNNPVLVDGLATISGTLRIKGNGLLEGVLTVLDTLTTHNLIVNSVSDFFDTAVFHKGVQFTTAPLFAKDTAGFAVIHKGSSSVDIHFDHAYAQIPIVQASLTTHTTQDATSSAQTLLQNNYSFVISHESPTNFTILLNKEAQDDVYLSWIAIAVNTPNLFESLPRSNVLGMQVTPTPSTGLGPIPSLTNTNSSSSSAGK